MPDSTKHPPVRSYIDDSIHDRGNFIVLTAVCAKEEDLVDAITAMEECGFVYGRDEFKSSMTMHSNVRAQDLRERFHGIIRHCKIAIGIYPLSDRSTLSALVENLVQAISINDGYKYGTIYLDEGIRWRTSNVIRDFEVVPNCDSRKEIGIQLADCCAHTISTMLLDELGIKTSMVPASRYQIDDDGMISLAWALWASIRYGLAGGILSNEFDNGDFLDPYYKPFGLVVSDRCDEEVKRAAQNRFGRVWLGCIS